MLPSSPPERNPALYCFFVRKKYIQQKNNNKKKLVYKQGTERTDCLAVWFAPDCHVLHPVSIIILEVGQVLCLGQEQTSYVDLSLDCMTK